MSADACDKLLSHAGPLERLFEGSSGAPILDFFMLAAQRGQAYSDSEIARYSGISLKKTKTTIFSLQNLGLVSELVLDDGWTKSGKKRRRKKYMMNQDSVIGAPLAKLVLALTDAEIKKPSMHVQTVSVNVNDDFTGHMLGEAATELIEKGLIKFDDQPNQDE